jgi:hypothetical protein
LTEHAKSRIANNLSIRRGEAKATYFELREKVGDERISSEAHEEAKWTMEGHRNRSWSWVFNKIVSGSETLVVFAYLQILCEENGLEEDLDTVVTTLNEIFETENILWRAEKEEDGLEFQDVVSEEMEASDRRVRESFESGEFQRSMEAYNEAWRMFSDEDFTYKIPEKLYNSIEEVLKEICVEKENWLDSREHSHKEYLNELSERDIFYPNKIMRAEMQDLMDSMEKFVSKAGKERKNEHSNIDEEYSRLLIHQTAAYLDFIITRYQSGDFRD